MKNRSKPLSGAIACSIVILIIVSACVVIFVPGVRAEESKNGFFNWNGVRGFVDHLVTQPTMQPPVFDVGDSLPQGYYTSDGCPVGIGQAPYPINPLMTSGALCRGACGPDCPAGRCQNEQMKILESRDKTGTCMYTNVIRCPTHSGCQEHDACYDWCEDYGYTSMLDTCHRVCNDRCAADYGAATCLPWADLPGSAVGSLVTTGADLLAPPRYSGTLVFSDFPKFTAYDIPRPPLSSTLTPTPALTPTLIHSPVTIVRTPTPSPTVTSGPDARLTVLMTGLSTEDLEGTTIGWDPEALDESCSPTSGGAQCILKFRYGTLVEVSAFPIDDVRFVGWFGSCSGSGNCKVSMTKDHTVTAEFSKIPTTIAITNYQDYCTENYPGSVYDRATQSCVFHGVTPTPTITYYGSGSGLTLIPLAGGCCPNEPCTTQIATAAGGTPPYTFSSGSLAAGSAPPMGMIIEVNGYLTGTAPSEMKTYPIYVCVKDLAGQSTCGESRVTVE